KRAPDDEDVVRPEPVADRLERAVELGQVARAVVIDGGSDAHEQDRRAFADVARDLETAGGDGHVERLLEPGLVDGDPTGPEHAEACRPGLDEANGVAEAGQADRADEADIAGADDGERAGF